MVYVNNPKGGKCRMCADTGMELHLMAVRIGVPFSRYREDRGLPCYSLTPEHRNRAMEMGARATTDQ